MERDPLVLDACDLSETQGPLSISATSWDLVESSDGMVSLLNSSCYWTDDDGEPAEYDPAPYGTA